MALMKDPNGGWERIIDFIDKYYLVTSENLISFLSFAVMVVALSMATRYPFTNAIDYVFIYFYNFL